MALNPTVRVQSIMTKKLVSIDKGMSIRSAIKRMVYKDIGPVLSSLV